MFLIIASMDGRFSYKSHYPFKNLKLMLLYCSLFFDYKAKKMLKRLADSQAEYC